MGGAYGKTSCNSVTLLRIVLIGLLAEAIKFWQKVWFENTNFQTRFSCIFAIARDKHMLVESAFEGNLSLPGMWLLLAIYKTGKQRNTWN